MYVLDSISTRPWPGTLDEIYPVHIQNWSPQSVEPGVTFDINYTVQNTSATTPWQVWGKLYIGDPEQGGQLISNFTSPGLIAPGDTYDAPPTTIYGGITSATLYTIEAGHVTLDEYMFTRSANPPAGGSVSGTQNGSYAQNYSVSVTASAPNSGYSWGGWTATGITLPNPNALNQAFNMPANTVSLIANYPAMGTGACCVGTNCYSNYTQAQCTTAGGTYHGDGSNCTPNPCGGGTNWLLIGAIIAASIIGSAFIIGRK